MPLDGHRIAVERPNRNRPGNDLANATGGYMAVLRAEPAPLRESTDDGFIWPVA